MKKILDWVRRAWELARRQSNETHLVSLLKNSDAIIAEQAARIAELEEDAIHAVVNGRAVGDRADSNVVKLKIPVMAEWCEQPG